MNALMLRRQHVKAPTPPRGPVEGGQRIRLCAEARLRRCGHLALYDVACDAYDGVVYLRGRLPSYHLRRLAQTVAGEAEGVRHVVNRIEVVVPSGPAPVGRDRV